MRRSVRVSRRRGQREELEGREERAERRQGRYGEVEVPGETEASQTLPRDRRSGNRRDKRGPSRAHLYKAGSKVLLDDEELATNSC